MVIVTHLTKLLGITVTAKRVTMAKCVKILILVLWSLATTLVPARTYPTVNGAVTAYQVSRAKTAQSSTPVLFGPHHVFMEEGVKILPVTNISVIAQKDIMGRPVNTSILALLNPAKMEGDVKTFLKPISYVNV